LDGDSSGLDEENCTTGIEPTEEGDEERTPGADSVSMALGKKIPQEVPKEDKVHL
jgi:hypothetical protein